MAKLQFATLSNFEEFLNLHNIEIAESISAATKSSLKTVSQSEDGYTIYFYSKEAPVTIDDAVFSVNLPVPVGKADKVKNAAAGNLAGLDADGNLADSGKKPSDFDAAGSAAAAKGEVLGYVGAIPAPSQAATVVAFIQELCKSSEYDDTALRALVNANTTAIGTLNGAGDGSVSKTVADAIAKIVADAPESFDTLKEISDWIAAHASDAAGMNSQINTNKTDIAGLKTRMTAAEGAVDAVESDLAAEKAKIAANQTAVSGLQSLVGDGYEPIPSASIKALFGK